MPLIGKAWCFLGFLVLFTCVSQAQAPSSEPDQDGAYMPSAEIKGAFIAQGSPAEYPSQAGNSRHISVLEVIVGQDGTPSKIEIQNAHSGPFEESAISAVKLSKFTVGTLRGQPVPVHMRIWVPFLTPGQRATPVGAPFKIDNVPVRTSSLDPKFRRKMSQTRVSTGVVTVKTLVDDEGNAKALHIFKSLEPKADELALQIVNTYQFKPALRDGVPVPVEILCTVNFNLGQ